MLLLTPEKHVSRFLPFLRNVCQKRCLNCKLIFCFRLFNYQTDGLYQMMQIITDHIIIPEATHYICVEYSLDY